LVADNMLLLELAQAHAQIFFYQPILLSSVWVMPSTINVSLENFLGFAAVSISFLTGWKFFLTENQLVPVCLNELHASEPGLMADNSEVQYIV